MFSTLDGYLAIQELFANDRMMLREKDLALKK
jgi:hypothetical protein